jgi:hypothetical protein
MFLALEAAWTRCELDAGSSAFHPPLARRPSKTFPLGLITWAFVPGAPTVADLEGTLQPVDTPGCLKASWWAGPQSLDRLYCCAGFITSRDRHGLLVVHGAGAREPHTVGTLLG